MNHNSVDGFEDYRRQRERMRRMGVSETRRPLSGPTNALRELEAVEAKEERDRQLSREMQDFFESATRTAADIVQKVAESAKLRIDQKLSTEMEEFLLESIARMQGLVSAVLRDNTDSTAEQVIEPLMHNLAGQMLDAFRSAGTAEGNKHLGQDPMATNLEEVRREFQAKMPPPPEAPVVPQSSNLGQPTTATGPRASIDEHIVADNQPGLDRTANAKQDLERFEQALDSLVRQGTMTKEDAKAALKARKSGRR